MKRLLFLPWSIRLREGDAPLDARQGTYGRQVPRYLSLRMEEVEDIESQFVPFCTEDEEETIFLVPGIKQELDELVQFGEQYQADLVICGQSEFGERAEISLQIIDVHSRQEVEQTILNDLQSTPHLFETLLQHLLAEVLPFPEQARELHCQELSEKWEAVAAFFCAIDRLMAFELGGVDEEPFVMFDLYFEALELDAKWEGGIEQLIGTALDYGLDERGSLEVGIVSLERLALWRDDLPKCWEALGHLYYHQQNYVAAITCLERCQRLDPVRFVSYQQLGVSYRNVEKFEEAEHVLREGLVRESENIPLLVELGVIFGECDRPQEAAELFRQAVKLSPISGAFYANLGVALEQSGVWEEAEEAFKAGMSAVDPHWNVYVNYSDFLQEQERHVDWVHVLFQGVQTLVEQPEERLDLASRLVAGVRKWMDDGLPEDVSAKGMSWTVSMLETLLEIMPQCQSGWVVLSECYRKEGHQERALECLTGVEGRHPENIWLKIHIGALLAGMQRFDEAVDRFEQVLVEDGENEMAIANLLMIAALRARDNEAEMYLNRYRQITQQDPLL